MTSRGVEDVGRGESGVAVLLVLLCAVLLSALGSGLTVLGNTEGTLAANYRAGSETLYVAEAAIEHALVSLDAVAAWSDVPSGRLRSPLFDSGLPPAGSGHRALDLLALTALMQARSDAVASAGADNPTWRLYACGTEDDLTGAPAGQPGAYVVVWVADDPAETDGDNTVDSNDVILLRSLAIHASGLRRGLQVAVRRAGAAREILTWRESSSF